MNYHTIVLDRRSRREVLYGPLDDTRHIAFPNRAWARSMINCDPRQDTTVSYVRDEDCNCDSETTIHSRDFMKLSHMERYGCTWHPTSTNPPAPTPIIEVEWSGERIPYTLRSDR